MKIQFQKSNFMAGRGKWRHRTYVSQCINRRTGITGETPLQYRHNNLQ